MPLTLLVLPMPARMPPPWHLAVYQEHANSARTLPTCSASRGTMHRARAAKEVPATINSMARSNRIPCSLALQIKHLRSVAIRWFQAGQTVAMAVYPSPLATISRRRPPSSSTRLKTLPQMLEAQSYPQLSAPPATFASLALIPPALSRKVITHWTSTSISLKAL